MDSPKQEHMVEVIGEIGSIFTESLLIPRQLLLFVAFYLVNRYHIVTETYFNIRMMGNEKSKIDL